jgi:antitoxin component YwqK of YwqJK toxin-antitoxin module
LSIFFKSYSIILILYLTGCTVFAQDTVNLEYKKFYYENGVISSEGFLRNGKPDGYWKNYYKNGKIKSEGNRKNFVPDSIWKFYNEDGILINTYTYQNGKKNGLKITYTPKGKIEYTEMYENDLKHGPTIYYYGTDSISKIIPFEKGREQGIGYEYDKQKNIISIITYKNGFIVKNEKINRTDEKGRKQGVWKTFYDNMNIKTECKYFDDKLNGYYKEYNEKGEVIKTIKYIDGVEQTDAQELVKLDVNVTEYYNNGKPKKIVTSKNGIKEGIERTYNEDGTISNSKIYKNGILVSSGIVDESGKYQGPFEEYYPDGTLKSKGEYKDGKKVGKWMYYYPNGVEEQVGVYKNDIPTDEWIWYYPNKQIKRKEKFIKGKEDGEYIEYDENGNIITKGNYYEGLEDGEWIYEYGDFKEIGTYKEGVRVGEWKGYFKSNNKLAYSIKYVDGNENGKFIFYYENGTPRIEGNYVMGLKEGVWKYYNQDGLLFLTETYKNDILVKIDGTPIKNLNE